MFHIKWVWWLILLVFEPAFAVSDSANYSGLKITALPDNDTPSLLEIFTQNYISPTVTMCNKSNPVQGLCDNNYTIDRIIRCTRNSTAPGCNSGTLNAPA